MSITFTPRYRTALGSRPTLQGSQHTRETKTCPECPPPVHRSLPWHGRDRNNLGLTAGAVLISRRKVNLWFVLVHSGPSLPQPPARTEPACQNSPPARPRPAPSAPRRGRSW